ncbi:lipopolysaccharide export system protein LptC [Endobacter medicaginis]|uniref:Lipopolysaccharide export system protein LptC n=2 Tax=Endobacter medicaginis TaxID=1181271 RepID=A0A839UWP7_9PROT|nr:LPS export ABC transporter periplasmic protein LptC [Endobacter medicaginis]MBB3172794.1 lipopolysaccharide export system protein LptC [Endobacter medicaginis]MCX5474401.1 LPS export ABC transporter periplasmic protein LptC [Endobacter medicaginis]
MNQISGPPNPGGERDADIARRRLGLADRRDAMSRLRAAPAPGDLARRRMLLRYGKFGLPAVALLLLGAIAVWPEINRQLTLASETARDVAAVRRDSGRMLSPHYSGIDSHDRPYTITAHSARQMGQNRIDLDAPVMDMSSGTGWVLLHADRGTYMQDSNLLALTGNVTLYRDDGVIANSPDTVVDLRGDVIASQDWIHADGPFGVLDAQGYMLAQNAGVAQFAGPARLVLNNDHVAQASDAAPDAAPRAATGTRAGSGTIPAARNPTQASHHTPHATHAHGHAHRRAGPHHR